MMGEGMKQNYKRKEYSEIWQAIRDRLGVTVGDGIILAMNDFYTVYTDTLPEWFASLYDARVGGFYYSASARDNDTLDYKGEIYGLLPDADSTCQALWTVRSLGLFREYGGDAISALPKRMQRDMIAFIKGLQDPDDGYIYHPQFPRKRNEEKINRRSRDTGRAASVLSMLGASFTYDTPLGHKGDGINKNGDPVSNKREIPKDRDTGKSTASPSLTPDYMASEESFRKHLDSLVLRNNSYVTGSHFVTQTAELLFRDKELRAQGSSVSLMRILTDWFTENQLENGTWNDVPNLSAVSGIMKICRLYSAAGVMMPRVRETVRATISVITDDEEVGSITDVFNPWYALSVILGDLTEIGGDEGAGLADEIRSELRLNAPSMLKRTKERLLPFLRGDGAFSYLLGKSGGYNMGMPLGIAGIDEGDMNATHLAAGLPSTIFSVLGLADLSVPVFGRDDMKKFLGVIEDGYKEPLV